jgi:hypothetical protein
MKYRALYAFYILIMLLSVITLVEFIVWIFTGFSIADYCVRKGEKLEKKI